MNKEYIYLPQEIQDLTNSVVSRISRIQGWIDSSSFGLVGGLVADTLRVQQYAVDWLENNEDNFSELGKDIINDEVKDVLKRTQTVFGILWGV